MKLVTATVISCIVSSCGTNMKIKMLKEEKTSAEVSVSGDSLPVEIEYSESYSSDTLAVTDLNGKKVILMNAVRDEESGEMVASEQLHAAVVSTGFKNIAERNGEISLSFDITIPPSMQDREWQVRFRPVLKIFQDSLELDEVHITGVAYRNAQLRGYEQYDKFLASIIMDPNRLLYTKLLKIFIYRNIPELAKMEKDTSAVNDTTFKSFYGITYDEVKRYYTKEVLKRANERKKRDMRKKFEKYVKAPLIVSGVKTDTLIEESGNITYRYTHTIATMPNLKKIDMVMSGSIFKEGKKLYEMPSTKPISFYISSISSFAENKVVYVRKIIERQAEANTAAYISFETGKYSVIDTLDNNYEEIKRIRKNIFDIMSNREYDLDSIVITASCSPEGRLETNALLAKKRADAIKDYFTIVASEYDKKLSEEGEIVINHGISDSEYDPRMNIHHLEFRTRYIPEEWDRLKKIIINDTTLHDREQLLDCFSIRDLDEREYSLKKCSDYRYVRRTLFPRLRSVRFDFHLHRKGMIKDTVHTTEIDTIYQKGLLSLENREYEKAISYLRPYSDFNTALAYSSMDYNASAISILEKLPQSAKRDYMLAILYSRRGEEKKAVESYIHSIGQDPALIHRGNLDPEVSLLIKKYRINTL